MENDALNGKVDEVLSYADKLYDINQQRFENNQFKGRSVLHAAAQKGQLELVKQLVQKLEDKNPQDEKGVTPLHIAAFNGQLQIVEHLVQHIEGDINPSASNGDTALHYAAQGGQLNVVSFYYGDIPCLVEKAKLFIPKNLLVSLKKKQIAK